MKKQEFLDELKSHLKVLQDEEQEDILDEYSQHIEIKIEKGLSEEEAIRDFGPIHALAAEILEAYHVKPEYQQEEKKRISNRISFQDLQEVRKEKGYSIRPLGGQIKKAGFRVKCAGEKMWRLVKYCIRKGISFLCSPFRFVRQGRREQITGEAFSAKESRDVERGSRRRQPLARISKSAGKSFAHGVGWMVRAVGECICFCFRLGWNFCIALASAGLACFGLFFLFALGMTTVLWIQGYPLFGVVLGCFGAVLCCFSFSVIGSTFFWQKKQTCFQSVHQQSGKIAETLMDKEEGRR